ncbi:slit homolog 2 protein-like [Gigantopelta aegis]|uniref:slit homolog 2 protein-like n=1 Tax=Gigantopelta aegis TaxID=1735272 RepID=UPI001B88D8E9|nr:slit homolog 2 protein-like [Gigantopelta aegis]
MSTVVMETLQVCIVFCCTCMLQVFACPQECMCSETHVNCYGRKLHNIPLDNPTDTTKLNFGNNEIERIDSTRFVSLTKLQELVLKYNKITSLELETFKYLKNMEKLDLGSNNIQMIEIGVFDDVPKLKEIDLSENFIENIDNVFRGLQNLERIDLGSNKIKVITKMAFRDLKHLSYLLLPNNEITKINRFAFRPLQSLTWITLTRNPLENANALFVKSQQLLYIDLTQCALTRIPSKFPPSVQYLQLGKNNITRIKACAFSRNTKLKILVLAQNEINVIDKGAFGSLKDLCELRLNDNKLTKFPSPFPSAVKSVYISRNKIQANFVQRFSCQFPAYYPVT